MTIEEKAKAYDEALEKVKPLYERAKKDDSPIWATYEHLFPQLTESEDERIRKELLEVIRHCYEDGGYTLCTDDYKKYSAYLEKQKEQKPIEPGCPQFVFDDMLALECAMDIVYRKGNEQKLYEALKSLHSKLIDMLDSEQKEQKPKRERKNQKNLGSQSQSMNLPTKKNC